MDTLRWSRAIGDTIFAVGAITFVVAVGTITLRRKQVVEVDGGVETLPKATARRD